MNISVTSPITNNGWLPITWGIYKHVLNNEVVYIGIAMSEQRNSEKKKGLIRYHFPRAHVFHGRKEKHKELFPQLTVEIICTMRDREKALEYERMLIEKHMPKFNIMHSPLTKYNQ